MGILPAWIQDGTGIRTISALSLYFMSNLHEFVPVEWQYMGSSDLQIKLGGILSLLALSLSHTHTQHTST